MPDKGTQIVIALLEKRESFLITKDTNQSLVKEILRAADLGYVQKADKSGKYTLSEKGRRWVYSGYADEDNPQEEASVSVASPPNPLVRPLQPQAAPNYNPVASLRPAYLATIAIILFFFLTIFLIWYLGLV